MKIGLVLEGGGMKCVYGAAILEKFLDDNVSFDYVLGVSAGSANAVSYVAKQKGRNTRFYMDYLDDPKFFGINSFIKTGNIFGLEYIYKELSNSDGKDPLDYDAIMNSPTELVIVATNALNGESVYFKKEDLIRDNYVHIMASCSLPAFCKPVFIDNIPYYDGGVSDAIPFKKAFEDGCDKLVVILSKPRNYSRRPTKGKRLYSKICKEYPYVVQELDDRHEIYNKQFDELFELEKEGKVMIFTPDDRLKISTFSIDKETEETLFTNGLDDYRLRKDELDHFLER